VAESRQGLSVRPLLVDLGRDYRGGQHQALLLLQGLASRGHAPKLIVLRDSLLSRRAKDAGISTYGVGSRGKQLFAALAVRRLLRKRQVDIIHANEPHALSAAWLARAHRPVPLIVSRRIAFHPFKLNPVSQAYYRAAKRIVAVSHFVERSILVCGFPPSQIEVIYDGVEIPPVISKVDRDKARARYGIPEGSTCIANVAAFVPEKRQRLLLGAIADLREQFPQCVLLLAGEGPERAKLQEIARQLRLDDVVKSPGFVADIESLYAATDLFVFPSFEEPLGSSLLSAMAYGLPVVAVTGGGVPEVVEDCRTGLLVKLTDTRVLPGAIARLLSNPAEARRFGEAARESIGARFSADRMVDATLGLYERLIVTHGKY
jgi:glycosyltransferase involved in cell wall biosynthesis